MFLKRLEIHNYKSLRNVVLEPGPLSVFVGPNAAGKSNLADALEFLALAYRWDLERAVASKGGFENIYFQGAQRTREPIRFRVVAELPDLRTGSTLKNRAAIDHRFEFGAVSGANEDAFAVDFEELLASRGRSKGNSYRLLRKGSGLFSFSGPGESEQDPFFRRFVARATEHDLMAPRVGEYFGWWPEFVDTIGGLRVFLLNPRSCREAGVPTPDSDLNRFGGNLPAVVAHLRKSCPEEYQLVLESLQRVLPSLEDVDTSFTHYRTLGLFLREKGVQRPWTSEEISDGTIQSLALLVATFDPRIPILVVEEPENSVHPWALRNLVEAFRKASETKQILLTTHSPILIDQLQPEEIWVVRRPERETRVDPLLSLDPGLKDAWGQGRFTLSEYLDSGAVPAAVPTSDS